MSININKVAVLCGGNSAEREVSLNSGNAIVAAFKKHGVNAHLIDTQEYSIAQLPQEQFTVAFIALHGKGGEDGTVQGALETLGLPYTGSRVLGSALAMDKWRCKLLWGALGFPIAPFKILNRADLGQLDITDIVNDIGLPIIVKPNTEGSSVGMMKVTKPEGLEAAIQHALDFDEQILLEKCLSGPEYTVSFLGEQLLPSIKIQPAGEFYDYHAKYISNTTQYHCPSGLSKEQEQKIQRIAEYAYKAVGCSGWGRVDIMMDGDDFYLLEVNTAPGMTSHSLVPMAARAIGLNFEDLVMHILQLAK